MVDTDDLLQGPNGPRRPPLARHASASSHLSDEALAAEWEGNLRGYRTVLGRGRPFTLADVLQEPEASARLHDMAKDFGGRAELSTAIALDVRAEVRALVLDRSSCPRSTRDPESYSLHTMSNEGFQMLAIARKDEEAMPVERARAVVNTALHLREESRLLLSRKAPVLAIQPDATSDPIRTMLATSGLGYAMRLQPGAWFSRIELYLDAADDGPEDYSVEMAFQLEAAAPGRAGVDVIPMRHLTDPATSARISEYLVRVAEKDESSYYVTRPLASLLKPPNPIYFTPARILARAASELPAEPLADEYGAHLFHHPNFEPWENVMMLVARDTAAMPGIRR